MFNLIIGMYPRKLKISPSDLPWKYEKPKPPLWQATPSNLRMAVLKGMPTDGAKWGRLEVPFLSLLLIFQKDVGKSSSQNCGRSIESGWETHSP